MHMLTRNNMWVSRMMHADLEKKIFYFFKATVPQ